MWWFYSQPGVQWLAARWLWKDHLYTEESSTLHVRNLNPSHLQKIWNALTWSHCQGFYQQITGYTFVKPQNCWITGNLFKWCLRFVSSELKRGKSFCAHIKNKTARVSLLCVMVWNDLSHVCVSVKKQALCNSFVETLLLQRVESPMTQNTKLLHFTCGHLIGRIMWFSLDMAAVSYVLRTVWQCF